MTKTIRQPKSKIFEKSNIFYVPSRSGGQEHIVVQVNGNLFCDCKDFMTRRLPLLGTAAFSNCTHGKQVVDFKMKKSAKTPKFGVFAGMGFRSTDIPGTFTTKTEAYAAIQRYEEAHGRPHIARFVEELLQ